MLKKLGYGLLVLIWLYLGVALALTYWPAQRFRHPAVAMAQTVAEITAFQPRSFVMRDGVRLFARQFGTDPATTVLLLHGVGSDSAEMAHSTELLRQSSGARVVALDLRGHGHSGGRPWSVSHAGQYDEDVTDVLTVLRREAPGGRLILAGHSMGGGIALRHALTGVAPVDGYLLIAPLLGPDSPSAKTSGGQSGGGGMADAVHFRTPRLFDVLLFNLIGVHVFDGLPILDLNQPKGPAYGFAALESMQPNAPKDFHVALRAIRVPLLLVAGSQDEAFNAAAYPDVIYADSHGEAVIAPGATHDGVLTASDAVEKIAQWLKGLSPSAA
jgi:alpha-beta hydrolase superfamily lysophospholipase